MITVKKIVKKWLEQNGYDGLAGDECCCEKDDLFVCGFEGAEDCVAGHKTFCPCEGLDEECQCDATWNIGDWCIAADKKEDN